MALLAIQHTVSSYPEWRPIFRSLDDIQRDWGVTDTSVHQLADAPNTVLVRLRFARRWNLLDCKALPGSRSTPDCRGTSLFLSSIGTLGVVEIPTPTAVFNSDVGAPVDISSRGGVGEITRYVSAEPAQVAGRYDHTWQGQIMSQRSVPFSGSSTGMSSTR